MRTFDFSKHPSLSDIKHNAAGTCVTIPRAMAVRIVDNFVALFSEKPLRECCHLTYADWFTVARMDLFELKHAVMWIAKLVASHAYDDPDSGRMGYLRDTLATLKADALEFPLVKVLPAPSTARRPRIMAR